MGAVCNVNIWVGFKFSMGDSVFDGLIHRCTSDIGLGCFVVNEEGVGGMTRVVLSTTERL